MTVNARLFTMLARREHELERQRPDTSAEKVRVSREFWPIWHLRRICEFASIHGGNLVAALYRWQEVVGARVDVDADAEIAWEAWVDSQKDPDEEYERMEAMK